MYLNQCAGRNGTQESLQGLFWILFQMSNLIGNVYAFYSGNVKAYYIMAVAVSFTSILIFSCNTRLFIIIGEPNVNQKEEPAAIEDKPEKLPIEENSEHCINSTLINNQLAVEQNETGIFRTVVGTFMMMGDKRICSMFCYMVFEGVNVYSHYIYSSLFHSSLVFSLARSRNSLLLLAHLPRAEMQRQQLCSLLVLVESSVDSCVLL